MERDVEAHQGAVDGMLVDQSNLDTLPSRLKGGGQASGTRSDDEQA
jgi:hypothetical protein